MNLVERINAKCSFNYGPRVDIIDNFHYSYLVEFYENLGDDWALVHSWFDVKPFHFYWYRRFFRTKWKIKVWGWENDAPVLVLEHLYSEQGQKIAFVFEHSSYKVQRKWTERAISFRDKNRCDVIIQSKYWERLKNDFFDERLDLTSSLDGKDNLYATYLIKKHDIPTSTENWWESDLIYEAHSKAFKSWNIPIDWVAISNDEVFDAIVGHE